MKAQRSKRQSGRTNVHKAQGRSQLSIFYTASLTRPDPNTFPWAPSHGTTRPARTKAQGSKRKTGRTNVHKAHEQSQLSIFYTAPLARHDPTRPARTKAQGSKSETGRANVHKARGRSQLSIFYTAALTRPDPNAFPWAPSRDPTRPNAFPCSKVCIP